MTKRFTITATLILLLVSTALAHHSYRVRYGGTDLIALEGVITEVKYQNPHVEVVFEVTAADGTTAVWTLDGPSPSRIRRLGIARDTLGPGMSITVTGWPAKDNSPWIAGRELTLPDGTTVTLRDHL